jgi:group II intron reverse transcriptase/maturase
MNVGEMQRKFSSWAERDKGRKFFGLYDLICDTDWLYLAYAYVSQNAGSKTAGCDGIDMATFEENLDQNIMAIQESLKTGKFEAQPVRRVYIPKSNGKMRPLGIPSICDRIVQEATRMVLEPIYEADFSQNSYGFRPNRRTMDAINYIRMWTQEGKRFLWVIEGDISAYFDTINHRKLMKLLGQRIADRQLLDLIWKFLRAGVMERKLFKDTKLGTPQGGIISPLLANVYLHELDKFMEKYTELSTKDKTARRRKGLANYAYVRYADDFVVLGNGSKEQVYQLRNELQQFLADALRLNLSLEKTKVTHLNDGFDYLGFQVIRRMGSQGRMRTHVLISPKGVHKHLGTIRGATAPDTRNDSIDCKILALNRIIGGWCRYYQYTDYASRRFNKIGDKAYKLYAKWLGRKHQRSLQKVHYQFKGNILEHGKMTLHLHNEFATLRYKEKCRKPNPYTTQTQFEREEMLELRPWLGTEKRPGMADLRPIIMERDGYHCRGCKRAVTSSTCHVDHISPVRRFKMPVVANTPDNLWTLCLKCHKEKTEFDRQAESRML